MKLRFEIDVELNGFDSEDRWPVDGGKSELVIDAIERAIQNRLMLVPAQTLEQLNRDVGARLGGKTSMVSRRNGLETHHVPVTSMGRRPI